MIVEPFAGSARYSLLHFENDVYLYDASQLIVSLWKYLIGASEKDILGLPDVPSKVSLDNYTELAPIERTLIGFHLCRGKAVPRKVGHGQNSWNQDKKRIAANLYKIRHFKVSQCLYQDAWACRANPLATWFVDPPYKITQERPGNTDRYPTGSYAAVDYPALADWCRTRKGLVIACEGEGADYLPFEYLTTTTANSNNRSAKRSREFVYIQLNGEQISYKAKGESKMNLEDTAGAATATADTDTIREPKTHDVAVRDEITDLGFRTEHLQSGYIAFELLGDRRIPEDGGGFATQGELLAAVRTEVAKSGVTPDRLEADREELPEPVAVGETEGFDEIERVIDGKPLSMEIVDDDAGLEQRDPDEIETDEIDTDPVAIETYVEPGSGQGRLPGNPLVINQPLTDATLEYHSIKLERVALSAKEKAAKDQMKAVAAQHPKAFFVDPDNSEDLIYVAGQTADGKDIVCRKKKTWVEEFVTEEIVHKTDDEGGGKKKKGRK